MSRLIKWSCVIIFFAPYCFGCERSTAGKRYPDVPPIWIVEDDPTKTIFSRKDSELARDRKVGDMLVIPVYQNYTHKDKTDTVAIAHPFVYQQGTDIEKKLSSFDQRGKLIRLIFWVPGYFPDGMGRIFPWVPTINGKKMVVVELQECVGKEENEINSAMKDLLLGGDFTVEEGIEPKNPLSPCYYPAKDNDNSYDAPKLVRSSDYTGKYYAGPSAMNGHVLWGLNKGNKITNRLSEEEKKTVTAFAAAAEKRMKAKQASGKTAKKVSPPDDKEKSR